MAYLVILCHFFPLAALASTSLTGSPEVEWQLLYDTGKAGRRATETDGEPEIRV